MKKMEFMRNAAKVIMDFFSELYLKNEYTSQNIAVQKQRGSFKIKYCGGKLNFYVYMTGSISYNTGSFVGFTSEFKEYYTYNENDNHTEVLEKFKADLCRLKPYLDEVLTLAQCEFDPFRAITFEYGKEFATTLEIDNKEEDELESDSE